MKITKDQLRNLISEELEVFDKKASLLEQKEKIERSISLLNEEESEDNFMIDEVVSGDNNEPEFEMKGTHLVEDEIETDEIWTKMEENWEALEEEWGEPKPSEDINSNEDMGDSEVTLGEPKPSDDIKGDLREKMSEEDAKEIEEYLSEQESLNEAMIKRKKLAGIYD